jgi:hypothetical protein
LQKFDNKFDEPKIRIDNLSPLTPKTSPID